MGRWVNRRFLLVFLNFPKLTVACFVWILLPFHLCCLGLRDFFYPTPPSPFATPLCLFFLRYCSSKLQDHLFTWQMQVSSIIVVILSIVQTLHNPEDEKYYIHELAKCILLQKLLVKMSRGTIFDFQSIADIHPDYNTRALLCCYSCYASCRFQLK